jgi:hypothetical protein
VDLKTHLEMDIRTMCSQVVVHSYVLEDQDL